MCERLPKRAFAKVCRVEEMVEAVDTVFSDVDYLQNRQKSGMRCHIQCLSVVKTTLQGVPHGPQVSFLMIR